MVPAVRTLAEAPDAVDLLVIGGGITGVCVAREAAATGLSVLLVDKTDIGAGTSAATTKYIHGGIRYLENLEVAVVRESLRERRILSLAAPHLVRQMRFLMPAWAWSRPGAQVLGLGVGLYGQLAFDRNRDAPPSLRIPRSQWLSRDEVLADVPWLQGHELKGAWAYYDTLNVFPERLLLEFLFTAVDHGAIAVSHARVTGLELDEADTEGVRAVRGARIRDALTGLERTISAETVVNAAGPWVDEILQGLRTSVRVLRSKGVHVLLHDIGGLRQSDAVFARAPSGGHVIVSPWQDRLLVGPTDTPIEETVDDIHATAADVDLVLDTLNQTLAAGIAPVTPEQVVDVTVGVRPLIAAGSGETYGASRRHEIHDHAPDGYPGLYSILGGKWTTGRATAEHLLRVLSRADRLGGRKPASTRHAAVSSAFAWADDPEPYLTAEAARWSALPLSPSTVRHLAMLYGSRASDVLALVAADPSLGRRISERPGIHDIAAQVVWGIDVEGARTLADVIDRRLTIGTLGGITRAELGGIADIAAPRWGAAAGAIADAEWARREGLRALWAPRRSRT